VAGVIRRAFPIVESANLANAVTSLSVVLGLTGSLLAARGSALGALVCGALAIPCDVVDGVIARRRGTASAFGAGLDTLADALSFCVLPVLLGHALGLPVWALPALVAFGLGGVWRLARFGVVGTRPSPSGRECFEGVPTAYAAACIYVLAGAGAWLPAARTPVLVAAYALLPVGMISALPFPKRGAHTRAMWGLVPAAVVAAWAAS
jgi:CDP-diacylglycerol--serine O-phosphatidyltransferase